MRGKVVLGTVAGLLFLWLLDAVIVTDAEEVEEKTARLIELANEGGPEAVDEIMDAVAGEFDAGGVTRNQIRRYLDKYIGDEPPEMVRSGGITAVWKKDRERFRIQLRISMVWRGQAYSFLATLFWAERNGEWKLVRVVSGWSR